MNISIILGLLLVVLVILIFVTTRKSKNNNIISTNLQSPYKVTYLNNDDIQWYLDTPNTPWQTVVDAITAGYNVIILTFLVSGEPQGNIQFWGPASPAAGGASLSVDQQIATVNYAHKNNAIILASVGGSTDLPYSTITAQEYGSTAATWVMDNHLDGIDFDLENINPTFNNQVMSSPNVTNLVDWITQATISARQTFDASGYTAYISHAPQAPYFGPIGGNLWPGTTGGYTTIYNNSQINGSSVIDWFNLQYYNQGDTCYTTYNGNFISSGSDCPGFPGTSIKEISSYGIPISKLVVGKPYDQSGDASNGWIDMSTLGQWLTTAKTDTSIGPNGYDSGIMFWSFHGPTQGPPI